VRQFIRKQRERTIKEVFTILRLEGWPQKKTLWYKDLRDRAKRVRNFHFKVLLSLSVNLQPRWRIFDDIAEIQAESQAVLDSIMKRGFQNASNSGTSAESGTLV
jgi:hypothetical protein